MNFKSKDRSLDPGSKSLFVFSTIIHTILIFVILQFSNIGKKSKCGYASVWQRHCAINIFCFTCWLFRYKGSSKFMITISGWFYYPWSYQVMGTGMFSNRWVITYIRVTVIQFFSASANILVVFFAPNGLPKCVSFFVGWI